MTAQDLVLILGPFCALFTISIGFLSKVAIDVRRATTETNKAVNNRPDNQPTLRELVENISGDMRELRHESNDRHRQNTDGLRSLSGRISAVELDLKALHKETDADRVKTDDDRAKTVERDKGD